MRRVFVISCGPPRTLGCLAFTMPITWRRRRRVREGEQLSSGEQPESEEPRAQIPGSCACSKLSPAIGLGPEARLYLGKMIEAAETQQMFWKRPMVCSPGQRDPRGGGGGQRDCGGSVSAPWTAALGPEEMEMQPEVMFSAALRAARGQRARADPQQHAQRCSAP